MPNYHRFDNFFLFPHVVGWLKVSHLQPAAVRLEQDVGGLDVTVAEPLRMKVYQCVKNRLRAKTFFHQIFAYETLGG
jgi:hypothetical protein